MGSLDTWLTFWDRPTGDVETTRRLRDRQTRKLVRHAWERVPYYRRLFEEAGVHPEQIQGVDDLSRIPVSTKRQRQRTPLDEKLARGVNLERCIRHTTSGSTGQPDLIVRTWWEEQFLLAHRLRTAVQLGIEPHYRNVAVGMGDTRRILPHRLGFFSTTPLDPALHPTQCVQELVRRRPEVIRGRPNVLERVVAQDEGQQLRRLGVRMVFSGSELLAAPTRRRIEEGFQAPVIDVYGAHEFNMIAWSCPQCRCYHTSDDSVFVEILKDGHPAAPGEAGEVVATALHSFAMPFIRFETGDIARHPAHVPPCRTSFGCLDALQGRSVEFITLSNGRVISPITIRHSLSQVSGMARFEVVQTARDRVRVTVEVLPQESSHPCREVLARCRQIFPPDVAVEVGSVPELEPGPGEKYRFIRVLE